MGETFVVAVIGILWTLVIGYFTFTAFIQFEESNKLSCFVRSVIAISLVAGGLSIMVESKKKLETEYPCVEYETSMRFNPATKTMMPMERCVERGRWVP